MSSEHKKSIKLAALANKKLGKRGDIRVDKLPHFRDKKCENKKWPIIAGYKNINVCSSAKGIWRQLSPMKTLPFITYVDKNTREEVMEPNGNTIEVDIPDFERYFQSLKTFPGEFDEKNDKPTKEWYDTRDSIWEAEKTTRHKKQAKGPNKNIPLFSWFYGQKCSYLEIRYLLYVPGYLQLIKQTEAYKELNKLLDEGTNIQLLDYDGYYTDDYNKAFNDTSKPFGHSLVLSSYLKGIELKLND